MNNRQQPNRSNQAPVFRRGGPRGPMVIEHAKDKKGTIKKLVKYVGSNKYLFFSLLFFAIVVALLNLVQP